MTYNNIGAVYDNQGDYPKALEFHLKALNIREKVLGKEHPDIAMSYNNIGSVFFFQGDYPKALEYLQKALSILEKVLGPDHPNTKTGKENMKICQLMKELQDGASEEDLQAILKEIIVVQ
jgi:tetratricopeptide (TPR) repeat protein